MAFEPASVQDTDLRTTICGVATGTPDGGVALVRVSGSQACAMVARLCESGLPPLRQARLRRLRSVDSSAANLGEDALIVVMRAPHSYTGEDVVEISVHAGAINVRQILSWLLEVGAVPAQAGEFTRRAFANGKLSLEQAEAVAAVIGAQTELELERARRLLAGELGRDVAHLRDRVFAVRVEVEANLDFPEDVEAGDLQRWQQELARVGETLQQWLAAFARTSRQHEDMRVVIAGPPNAGKSSLFNALLGRRRALVSPIAGTTRDFLEAEIWLGHRRVIVIDTAGLHDSQEALERSGIELGREQIARAAAVVWVESAHAPVLDTAERVRALGLAAPKIIEVENKRDLACARPQWLGVSTIDGQGLETLVEVIANEAKVWYSRESESAWIGNARHAQLAQAAAEQLVEAAELVARGEALEVAAFALGCADRHLAAILGQDAFGPVGAEVLDAVFSRFCIGK